MTVDNHNNTNNSFFYSILFKIFFVLYKIRYFYTEYKSIIRCISFIIYIYFYISYLDISNFNFETCVWLLQNICLVYTVYIKYINSSFRHQYPKIDKFMNIVSNIFFWYDALVFIGNLNPQPTSSSSNMGSPNNPGPQGPGPNGSVSHFSPIGKKRKWHPAMSETGMQESILHAEVQKRNKTRTNIAETLSRLDGTPTDGLVNKRKIHRMLKNNHGRFINLEENGLKEFPEFNPDMPALTWLIHLQRRVLNDFYKEEV